MDEINPKSDCLMTPIHLSAYRGHMNICNAMIAMCKEMNNHFKVENLKNAEITQITISIYIV